MSTSAGPSPDEQRYRTVAQELHAIAKPLRLLSALAWPETAREEFLAGGGEVPPEVSYPNFDPAPVIDAVRAVRRRIYPGAPVDDWFESTARALEETALLLAARGTPAFLTHSGALYGTPVTPMRYDRHSPLQLAEQVHHLLHDLGTSGLVGDAARTRSAEDVAAALSAGVRAHFDPDDAPAVEIVQDLSANAVATASRIRVRAGARFTDRDGDQLLQHEAFVHVLTALNGKQQVDLPILAIGHPGTTRTQEGLAVLAEFVSGTLELDRFRRLADRVVAVQMALDGADFVHVFRWFVDRSATPEQAFESTRRIFRGAPLTGGAAFTKDCVYLSGFLSVSTFVRAAFSQGRLDCIGTLFCGKLDLADIPALVELRRVGLCRPPRYRPPWVLDPGWTLTWLAYSAFAAAIDWESVDDAARHLLARTPPLDVAPGPAAASPSDHPVGVTPDPAPPRTMGSRTGVR